MDIEKLIERLKKASADGSWNTLADYAHKAATALSTFQAELEQVVQKYETAVKLQVKMTEISNRQMAELEQVKAERDAAVKTIFQWTGCPECKWWDSAGEWCEKHDRYADSCGGCDSPEWRGPQKED